MEWLITKSFIYYLCIKAFQKQEITNLKEDEVSEIRKKNIGIIFQSFYLIPNYSAVEKTEGFFNRYGVWAILIAAFTPIPYKVFAILSGVLQLDMKKFLIASLIGRGGRFITLGVLIAMFGDDVRDFLENEFQTITILGGAVLENGEIDWSNPSIRDGGGLVTLRIFDCLKPVISACNGPAVGVGVTMQLAMDIRLASEEARYGFVFARRGLVPEACSSWFLPKIVGISQALEWVYSGKVFPAEEALRGGLVRSIHKADSLLEDAKEIALEITKNCAPVSVALSRQMLWKMAGADHPMEAHKIDSRGIFARGRMQDAKEGVTSFLEKREAKFSDGIKDIPDYYPWWDEKEYS